LGAAMRWVITILLMSPLVAFAAGDAASFQKLAQQAAEARQANRLAEALGYYQKAVELRPNWSDGWWWLGTIYYDQELYPEARDSFAQSVARSEKPTAAYAFVGLCEYEMRKYAEAREHLSKWMAAETPGDTQLLEVARFRWEELLIRDGHFFEALQMLNRDVQAHGPDPSRVEAMGLAWMQIEGGPEDYPPEKREIVWLAGSASASMSAGKMDRCREFLDRLAKRYGDRPHVHFLRAFVEESSKDPDGAISEYKKELEIAPQAVAPMIQLALQLAETGQPEEAMAVARRATVLEPANARGHYALGRALFAGDKWAESAAEFEKAQALAPNASKIRFQLAKTYRKLGRLDDAKREDASFEILSKKEQTGYTSEDPAGLKQQLQERER
jgi:tetratricopeptide (TPR) repeat protein